MEKVESQAGPAPQAIVRPCGTAMYRPRERTVQELLRHTQKIAAPRPSPVHTDGARMQGPGVKEECCTCGSIISAEELQQCSACDRGFHSTCLDPLVNITTPEGHWSCGLCDVYKSRAEDTGATDRTAGDSMTSSQNTGGQWNSTASGGKKKLTHTRGLKEVVKQEEASFEDSKSLQTASHEGEASRRSKRGRPLKSTAQILPLKRRRADAGVSNAKPDDEMASCSVPEQLVEAEEPAVESGGQPVLPTFSCSNDASASVEEPTSLDERVPSLVVKTESSVADVDNVGSKVSSIDDVDKLIQLDVTELKASDGNPQSLAMRNCSSKSNAVVPLPKVSDIRMVTEFGESDASNKVSDGELKLQDTGADTTPSSLDQNVGDQPLNDVGELDGQAVASERTERTCENDPVSTGNEEENVAITHAEREPSVGAQHALESTANASVETTTGRTSSVASLLIPPSPSVRLTSSSPPLNKSGPSVSNTSSVSTASPFEGFHSEPRDVTTFTSPVTPQFSKPAPEQGGSDGKISSVAKPLFKGSVSSSSPSPIPTPSFAAPSKLEKTVPGVSSPRADDKPQPFTSLPQPPVSPTTLPPEVSSNEALDSQLSNLVSGLPVPSQRARKALQASLSVVEGNGLVTQPARKPKSQTMDVSQSGRVSKELNKSTMRDQGHVKNAPLKVLENGTSRLDADENVSGRSKDPNAEEDRDGSPSNLLVEDVKVCDTCGNAGYEELLAVCSGCSEGAEHTYCMRFQMDALPDGEWYCETCQMKQRQGGPKLLERVVVPSKSLGRSTSINNRPKPVTMHNNARSRLTGRLNNKKPRMTPVRKSPSKAPSVQTPVKRSMSDSLMSPVSRKLPTESSSWASPSTSPPSTVPVSTPSAKPSLTRENTFKSGPDTGKVKFLAPSAVANFSSGARASTVKSVALSSQPLKAAASGQAGNKSSRFASLSSISESSTHPLSKSPGLNTSRTTQTTSPVPVLSKSPSGKLSADFPTLTKSSSAKTTADFPSFLLTPNSRQGNGLKGPGQLKNSRDVAVPDGASTPSSGREGLLSASQASGSKLMRLGRNASSSGLTGEFRPSPDTPRPSMEYGRGPQRAGPTGDSRPSPDTPRPTQRLGQVGEPRPSPDTPRPPLEPGRMAQRSGQGSGVAGTGLAQDASKAGGKDKASCRFEPASGVGPAVAGKGTMEPPGFSGKQLKPNTSVWSAPWLGDPCSTRCFSCKAFGHSTQDCPSRNSSVLEQKAVNGSCTSPGTSPKPPKSTRDAIPVFSDIDAHLPSLGTKPGKEAKGNSGLVLHALQSASELVPGSGIVDYEKSKPLLPSPTPTDHVFKRSSSFKSHDSSAVGSTNSSLFNSTPFQQLVMGQTPPRVSSVGNGDISCNNQGLKVESGGSNPWTPSATYDNEGPPGVTGTETAQTESKLAAALPKNISPVARSESCPLVDPSQVTGSKEPQGHAVQSAEAVAAAGGPAPPIVQRVHNAWAPRPHWLEGLPPHNVQGQGLGPGPGQGPGHVGYLPGLVQSFTPLSGPAIYGQSPPMSYLTSPPPPPLPPYGGPGPGPAPIPTPVPLPASPALLDAAVPSAAVAWRGAFEVNDGQSTVLFDEILAHVSTKAVAKVHEVATSLPPQLRLEQVQRSLELETWPRQFSQRPPNDGSIALYFFADNGESFEKFRHNLVETMVARDLVLRAQVDDAELLIFPSNKLSEKFQRWHGHMFLWGVFRAKKQAAKIVSPSTPVIKGPPVASPCIEVAKLPAYYVPTAASVCSISSKEVNLPITGCEGTGEMDMEVDMEGGREFGVSDKAVKRPDSANPPSTPPLSPTGASMKTLAAAPAPAAVAFVLESAVSDAAADRVQGKAVSIKTDDLDLPPGFAPTLAFPPTPVALEPPNSASSLPPGFGKKLEVQKQQDEQGAGADVVDASEMGGTKLKRSLSSVEVVRSSITQQASPLSGPCSRENDGNAPSSRPATTKRSRSLSRSPSRQKEWDKVRDKLCERVKERERRELDPKHGGQERAREWAREVHRDRDRDREYEREKGRWDRSKERERARPREKDRGRERDRARDRDRDRDRDRERERGERDRDRAERERDRDRERERLMERGKDRKHRSRDLDQDLDSRARYRRSRSRSQSRSLARWKARSRSPVSGRRKARSRTPPRQRSRSPSPSRRYRRLSVSGSDSPDSQSLEILQGSAMTATRSRKSDRDSLQGKRNASDKEGGDKSSRPRWKARSGSAGASNSKTVGKLGHPHTVPASRSVTPVLDMNEGVSEAFSAEGAAAASTSLPDLNTDSVESGVAFHHFLPADDGMPARESDPASQPMAEQTFFPRAEAASGATPARTQFQRQESDPHLSAREKWGAAVSSLGFASRLEYNHSHASTRSASVGYQFLHPPRLGSDSVHIPNPDLELALGGRERSPEVTVPLRLFADGHACSSSDLAFGLHSKSPELSVSLGTPHPQGPSAGGTASLSLSLAVPQYRKEGNSYVEVEKHGRGVLVSDDVDFALTL